MPAGKQQTARHDGGTSRICHICGMVGARTRDHNHRLVHRRCVGPVVTIIEGARVHGDKPMSKKSKAAMAEVIKAAKRKLG